MNYIIFSFIYIIQIVLTAPTFQSSCSKKTLWAYSLYFSHHIFDIFLFWGPLFLRSKYDFLIHAITTLLIMIHWLTYDNKCIWTVLMNRECKYPEEQWLDSLKNMIHLRDFSEYFHFIWIGGLLIYDIYQLLQ
jgi:hypothetical protein